MNFECISSVFFNLQKSTLNAICGVPEHWAILLFVFDVWFWRYLSWPDIFWRSLLAFRSRLWTLFVVFQSTWPFYCLPSMLDFDAICRGRTSSVSSCFPSEVDFERYLSCLELLLEVQSVIFNIFLMILRLRPKILSGFPDPNEPKRAPASNSTNIDDMTRFWQGFYMKKWRLQFSVFLIFFLWF